MKLREVDLKRSGVSFLAPIKGAVRASVVLTWAGAISTTSLILLLGVALDDVLRGRAPSGGLIGAMFVAAGARGVCAAAVPYLSQRAAGSLEVWARDRLWRQLLAMGAPLRSRERTGRLVSTATEGVESIAAFHATFLGPMIAAMTVPLLVIGAIAVFIDGLSALILLAAVPVIPGMVRSLQKRFASVSTRYRAANGKLSAQFLDAVQGLPTLKLFDRSRAHGETLAGQTEALRKSTMRLLAANQIVLFVVDALFALGMITAAATLAMVRLRARAITPGEAVALVLLGVQLVEPLDKVGQFFYVGMSGRAATAEARALLAEPPAFAGEPVDAPASRADGSVTLDDVRFSYDEGSEVLRGVSFRVDAGDVVALVGPSGAGKTTVAGLLQRQLAPSSGVITIGGVDVASVPASWSRAQIAVVPQTTYLFTGTIRDNLLVARADADDETLWRALDAANLSDLVRALPDGLDARVGERGLTLSGGEAQRLAIARALLRDAPVVVLDEPTSNIDAENESVVFSALERLTAGRTVIVIAHRLSTVRGAKKIVVLEDGVVTEHGSHDDLLARGGHYAAAVRASEMAKA